MGMKIGELARLTRVSTATIRYYESIGLLPTPARAPGNQRRYDQSDVQRLALQSKRLAGWRRRPERGHRTPRYVDPCWRAASLRSAARWSA